MRLREVDSLSESTTQTVDYLRDTPLPPAFGREIAAHEAESEPGAPGDQDVQPGIDRGVAERRSRVGQAAERYEVGQLRSLGAPSCEGRPPTIARLIPLNGRQLRPWRGGGAAVAPGLSQHRAFHFTDMLVMSGRVG